jgi:hypothetical protein
VKCGRLVSKVYQHAVLFSSVQIRNGEIHVLILCIYIYYVIIVIYIYYTYVYVYYVVMKAHDGVDGHPTFIT